MQRDKPVPSYKQRRVERKLKARIAVAMEIQAELIKLFCTLDRAMPAGDSLTVKLPIPAADGAGAAGYFEQLSAARALAPVAKEASPDGN